MKAKIHPQYFENIKIICSCGNTMLAGSTKKEIHTEICSACHPFYTGQQKLVDTAGRVDKFLAKMKKAKSIKEKSEKKVNSELDNLFEEAPETAVPEETTESDKTEEVAADTVTVEEEPKVKKTKTAAKKTAAKKTTARKSK